MPDLSSLITRYLTAARAAGTLDDTKGMLALEAAAETYGATLTPKVNDLNTALWLYLKNLYSV